MTKEPEPRARRQTARRIIDWHRAAELLAGGMPIATVAELIGCSPATLSRKRRHHPAFQNGTVRPHQPRSQKKRGQLGDLRGTVQNAIQTEVGSGNLRAILWLADRLKLVTPLNEHTPEHELRAILGSLTAEELREFEELRDDL